VAVLLVLILIHLRPVTWRWAAIVAVIFAELAWTSAALLRPQSEAALTAPDAVTALLAPAAARGERSFAPYGGVAAAQLVAHDLRAADGYDSFVLTAYADLARVAMGCSYTGFVVAAPPTAASAEAVAACPTFAPNVGLLRRLNIRYVILPEPADLPEATLVLTEADRWVYDFGPGRGRAFGVARAEVAIVQGCAERLATLSEAAALVDRFLTFPADAAPPRVLAQAATLNSETFTVQAPTAGLLVRSETWAPGWRVAVDGVPAEVLRADCALQGVWLEPGEHQVQFTYAPMGYEVGKWVSALTALALVLGAVGWGLWRRRGG
jgi:hypothetical protein